MTTILLHEVSAPQTYLAAFLIKPIEEDGMLRRLLRTHIELVRVRTSNTDHELDLLAEAVAGLP